MFGPGFRDFVSQEQSRSSKILKKSDSRDSGAEEECEILEKEEIKERCHSEDSGNCSEAEEEQSTNGATRSEFQLTQSLLSKVKAGENNKHANSGKQAQLDLKRMNFVINGKTIDKKRVSGLCNKNNHLISNGNEDYRTFAKQVFTGMFKHVEADVPSDNILAELITNCNQAGYECAMHEQIQPILAQYNLISKIFERTISIRCDSTEFVSVEYSEVMHVLNFDNPEEKICELNNLLKFTLKSQDGKVEYKDGKVTLAIPEQLKDYKAGSKSLLGDINRHFEDADNAVVESLVANIGEGPKSFVADPPAGVDSDVDNSFDIIPKSLAFDELVDIINKAKNGDYNDLNEVINNIREDKENDTFITGLNRGNFESFCSQELNLTAQTDHERVRKVIIEKIYRKENATVKGLVLLAIAANDTLVERYARVHEGILFTQDEELDSLLIGAGKRCYIKFLLEHLEKELDSILSWRSICEKLKRVSLIGNQECVKAILNRFEDTESRNPAISSKLLLYVVEKGDYDLVNLLIKNGANVNIHDRNDKTALHYAVSSYGDIQNVNKMVMLLVESGANIDIQDSDGKTALHYAAASNKDEIVRLLLKEGANETIKDKSGETFLSMVASETKSFLLNVLHKEGLLYHAVKEGNIDRAKRLLAKGKNVNAKNRCDESPLSVAIQNNRLEIVKLFLEKGAEVGKKEVKKAIQVGNLEVIELLVSKGAVITEKAIQYARDVYKNCEEGRVCIAKYPGGMKAERQNRKKILDFLEGKNMNNVKASIEEATGNNYRSGKMPRNKNSTNQKDQELLDAIYSPEKMENYLKRNNIKDEPTLNSIINKVNAEIQKKKKEGKSIINPGPTKKQKCINQINALLKTIDFLKKKIESIRADAKAAVSSVTDVSATTSSHEAPVNIDDEKKQAHIQPVESESKGDQQGSPPLLPQSSVSGDVEGTEASANAAVTIPEKVDSLVSDGEHGKIVSKEHPDDVLEKDSSSDDGNSFLGDPVPTSTNEISGRTDGTQNKEASFSAQNDLDLQNKSATVLSVDSDEEKQASPSNGVFYDATNSRDGSTLEGDSDKQEPQPKSVPTPLVANENYGQVDDTQTTTKQLEESISPSVPPAVHVSQNNINVQLSNSTPAVTATRSSTPTTQVVPVPAAPAPPVTSKSSGQVGNVQINGKQSANPSNIANASSDVNSKPITKEPVAPESNQQSSEPPLSSFDLSSPQRFVDDEVSLIAGDLRSEASTEDDVSSLDIADDECSEASSTVGKNPLIMDVTDEKEPLPSTAEPDFTLKSSNSPQSTKSSKLPTVATWTLAVAGILAGVAASVAYFAFGASLLAVGITAGVGACCLVAAAIIYYCSGPSNSLEKSSAEAVAATIGTPLKP